MPGALEAKYRFSLQSLIYHKSKTIKNSQISHQGRQWQILFDWLTEAMNLKDLGVIASKRKELRKRTIIIFNYGMILPRQKEKKKKINRE